jgi:hypothetical protein
MLVRKFAMFMSSRSVVLRLSMLADRMVMLCLMMVMCGGVMVSRRLVVMFTSRMFCH